jgi:hypothetical protein
MTATYLEPTQIRLPSNRPISIRQKRRLARSEGYLHAANRRFLEGTTFRTPVEAVEAGAKSIQEWCDCLANARLEYRVNAHLYGE